MFNPLIGSFLLFLFFFALVATYIIAVVISNQSYRKWPLRRIIFLLIGGLCGLVSVFGPLAHFAHSWFPAHMITHLLLGMLAPLFFVIAAPITLLLRTLPVTSARVVTRLFRSWFGHLVTHPIFTTLLNVGGLWILYRTDLYQAMHENLIVFLFIHLHVFIAGYLFTSSFLYVDPVYHRLSYLYRSIVLVLSLAAHGILSKSLYVNPPTGVPVEQAQLGSQIMYYGGDIVDLMIIFLLCREWYRSTRPRMSLTTAVTS
ncbi:cytochrome c oxidase assembly protein [Alkalihalobacillus sp. FSL W8-0930]